jgi:large subunit ribosomal protein L5
MNPMKQIRIEKITLNVGAGTNPDKLKKGMKVIKNMTGLEPVKTVSDKRIPGWGVRPGLPIGCKLTLRGKSAYDLTARLIKAKDNILKKSFFDNKGNLSFGIHEYIDVPDLNYDPEIGIMGFQASISLSRPGYRVKNRKKLTRKVGKNHQITKEEGIKYFQENFKVKVEE